jgi:hypothetical protein
MTQKELDVILEKHKKWLTHEEGGERADLRCTDLSDADFSGVNLHDASFKGAWLTNANLIGADLRYADLRNADLFGADLRNADLDFSCLPLWCGSLHAHFDDRQLKQIAYHLVKAGLYSRNASEETKRELAKLIDFANGFHRAEECGILKNPFEEEKQHGN